MTYFNQAAKTLARNGWRPQHGLCLFAFVGLAIVATWPAWAAMSQVVIRNEYARSSILVLPVIAWLVWVRRARFRFVKPGGPGLGLVILVSGIHLYLVAHYVYALKTPWYLGALMIVVGAFLMCTGKSIIRPFLPAWLILPLLVPVPVTLAVLIAKPIQLFEAESIAALYGLFGVTVEVITSPGTGRIVVGGETSGTAIPINSVCKGLPTILSLMLISFGFVFGSPMRAMARSTLLLIAPFIALICSALLLGGTLWLYNGRPPLIATDLIRALSEWATLLLAFLLIAGVLKLLTWASVPVHQYHLASTSS
ncbi:MAG: archaeosortase/exosortase family protein [Planctomycetota bacterium]